MNQHILNVASLISMAFTRAHEHRSDYFGAGFYLGLCTYEVIKLSETDRHAGRRAEQLRAAAVDVLRGMQDERNELANHCIYS